MFFLVSKTLIQAHEVILSMLTQRYIHCSQRYFQSIKLCLGLPQQCYRMETEPEPSILFHISSSSWHAHFNYSDI